MNYKLYEILKNKIIKEYVFTILTINIFFFSISPKINYYFILFTLFLFLLFLFFLYFFFRSQKTLIPDFSKIFFIKNYIIAIFALLFLYLINLSKMHYTPYSCKIINLNIICDYYILFYFLFFIIIFFFFLQIKLPDIKKIFIRFGLFFFIISLFNLIIFYLKYFDIIDINFLITFQGDYNFYWQFLPFALEGLRSIEIIPFILGYVSAISLFKLGNKKYEKYIYLFFISIFLTYSKNAWFVTFIITFALLVWNKKNLNIIKNNFILLIIVILLISTFQSILIKKFHTNIIPYTLHKLLPSSFNKEKIFSEKYYNDFGKIYGKDSLSSSKEYLNYLFDSTPARLNIYKNIIQEILNRPFLGHGLNAYFDLKINSIKKLITDNFESYYLTILVEVGFIGFFIYLYLIVYTFKQIKKDKEFCFTVIITFLLLSLFYSYQRNIFIFYLFAYIFSNIIKVPKETRLNSKS
jgi:hypothetical protein